MKRFITATLLATCFVAACPILRAQDCSSWTNFDLRGTYGQSGSGFIDLSKAFPGVGLPSGTVPMFWIGAFSLDGDRSGTGWVQINAGGNLLNVQLVNQTYAMNPDCSVRWIFSMHIKEVDATFGPIGRRMVVVPTHGGELELDVILGGTPPGMPASPAVDRGVAHRISILPGPVRP